jgi:predicted deacylase
LSPATKKKWTLPVVPRADGSQVGVPVLAMRGSRPGKTLLVTAGVHGDEFEGMEAIWKLFEELDAAKVSGTLVAVPVVNPPAYEAGLRTNPDDRQDMARVFPGHPAGTVTEQLAHSLAERFIKHADFFIDLHSAGQYYTMPALVGYPLRSGPQMEMQRSAARAMGLPLVWGTTVLPGRSLSVAVDAGVPALYTEITGEGRCRPADVAIYKSALERLLHHLGMIDRAPAGQPPRWVVEDDGPQAGFLQVQNRAPVGGYFEAFVKAMDEVKAGQRVGVLRDPLSMPVLDVTAPHAGLVVFLRTYPRVHAGEPLCTVLELR